MKVKLEDEVLYEIDERMIKLISHDIIDPIAHIKHLLRYFVQHKCDQCFARLESEYIPKLREDPSITVLPIDKRQLADLIFSHPSYKNRADREKEAAEKDLANKE